MTRLIDADELNEYIGREALDTREKIFALVDRMPTVERPHGEWIDVPCEHGIYCKCSLCDNWGHWEYNFCPNCGADMRKAGDEK